MRELKYYNMLALTSHDSVTYNSPRRALSQSSNQTRDNLPVHNISYLVSFTILFLTKKIKNCAQYLIIQYNIMHKGNLKNIFLFKMSILQILFYYV